MIIKSPILVPVDRPILRDGAVVIREDTIVAVGPASKIEKEYPEEFSSALELRNTVLLPGFVNAHSHLELTALRGLPYPGNFSQWIRKIVVAKPELSTMDVARGIEEGIHWMLESGITTVGDHVSVGTDITPILQSPLRGRLFLEVLGAKKEIAEDLFNIAQYLEKTFEKNSGRFRVSVSPHSAHAIHPEILPLLFQPHRTLFSLHLAESHDEEELFKKNAGPLFTLIAERGEPLRFSHPSSLAYLEALGLLSNKILMVHGNYLQSSDVELLLKHRMSMVHCPGSHAYFSHQKFPLSELKQRGITIALGTDSLASGTSLSMLDQIRVAAQNYPEISPEEWITMATLNGARALKMDNEVGSLTPGKKADLIGFPLRKEPQKNPSLALREILEAEKAHFVMAGGKIMIE